MNFLSKLNDLELNPHLLSATVYFCTNNVPFLGISLFFCDVEMTLPLLRGGCKEKVR